jgi:hypothetical protein
MKYPTLFGHVWIIELAYGLQLDFSFPDFI